MARVCDASAASGTCGDPVTWPIEWRWLPRQTRGWKPGVGLDDGKISRGAYAEPSASYGTENLHHTLLAVVGGLLVAVPATRRVDLRRDRATCKAIPFALLPGFPVAGGPLTHSCFAHWRERPRADLALIQASRSFSLPHHLYQHSLRQLALDQVHHAVLHEALEDLPLPLCGAPAG